MPNLDNLELISTLRTEYCELGSVTQAGLYAASIANHLLPWRGMHSALPNIKLADLRLVYPVKEDDSVALTDIEWLLDAV